jgi:hypothetical protein
MLYEPKRGQAIHPLQDGHIPMPLTLNGDFNPHVSVPTVLSRSAHSD